MLGWVKHLQERLWNNAEVDGGVTSSGVGGGAGLGRLGISDSGWGPRLEVFGKHMELSGLGKSADSGGACGMEYDVQMAGEPVNPTFQGGWTGG
eukprot:352952-Chlamydomonas_euryale.AAC.11